MSLLNKLLGELFVFIYNTVSSLNLGTASISEYAITLIVMGLIYKVITIPFTISSAKKAQKQRALQPEMDKLRKKYGYDQQIYQKKLMEFQKEHKVMQGMGTGCVTFILQLIIIVALYNVVRDPKQYLEGFENINRAFLWVPDLSLADPTGYLLPLINSLSQLAYQFLLNRSMGANEGPQAGMMNAMYVMPIVFFFVFRTLPAGLILYWSIGNIVEILVRGIVILINMIRNKN